MQYLSSFPKNTIGCPCMIRNSMKASRPDVNRTQLPLSFDAIAICFSKKFIVMKLAHFYYLMENVSAQSIL